MLKSAALVGEAALERGSWAPEVAEEELDDDEVEVEEGADA